MNINEKLIAIQEELKAPKNLENKFGGYKYRNAEAILEALKPLLAKNKATLTLEDNIMVIGERYYLQAIATFIDCESNDKIVVSSFAREQSDKKGMDSAQITGSTSSYARKYTLNGLFLLDDTKDPDSNEYKETADKKAKSEVVITEDNANDRITSEQLSMLKNEAKKSGIPSTKIKEIFGLKNIEDMTQAQFHAQMNKFIKEGE